MHVMSGFSVADLIESTMVSSKDKNVKEREAATLDRSETDNPNIDRDAYFHNNKNQNDIRIDTGKKDCDLSMTTNNTNAFRSGYHASRSIKFPPEVPDRRVHLQYPKETRSTPTQDPSSKTVLNILHGNCQSDAFSPFNIIHSGSTLAYFATLLDLPRKHFAETNAIARNKQLQRNERAATPNDDPPASLLPLIQWDQFIATSHHLQGMARARESNGSFCNGTGDCLPAQHPLSSSPAHIRSGTLNRPVRAGLYSDEPLENASFLSNNGYDKVNSLHDFNSRKVNSQIWWQSRLAKSMRSVDDFISPREDDVNQHIPAQHYRSGNFEIGGQPASGTLSYLSDGRKPKRIRTAFSPSQLFQLEGKFERNHYVVGHERKELASELGLSETQVKVWFQNRRTKFKRLRLEEKGLSVTTNVSGRPGTDSASGSPVHRSSADGSEENGEGWNRNRTLHSPQVSSANTTSTAQHMVSSLAARSPRKFEPVLGINLQSNASQADGNFLHQDEVEAGLCVAKHFTTHSRMTSMGASHSVHRCEKARCNLCPCGDRDGLDILTTTKD